MRITRLDLKAFGPFTDRMIEFDAGVLPGLHVIFGPNEAGKSSSLRALKALLYGFPERTSDNFRHANDQLQVGGCLESDDGQKLSFYRRKRRKADLLDLDGNPLDPGILATFLSGIEPALFESLYGIDHKILVAGGEDILAQKGEVGQALFAAGTGISSLKKILDSLEAEANELFRERGSKPQINQAIKKYKELKRKVRDESLPPAQWKEHRKRHQDAEAEHARLEAESRRKSAEVQRLLRLNKAIPELAALENLQNQLLEFGEVVVLPPDFSSRLREVEQGIRETGLQLHRDQERFKKLEEKQDAICLNQMLLDQADTIEDLHQRLGEYRKGKNDRGGLEGMRTTCSKDAGMFIEAIRPDLTLQDVDSLRPVLGRKRSIQDLSSRFEALKQQEVQAQKQGEEAERDLEKIAGFLSKQPAPKAGDGLAKVIKLARKPGDVDTQIEEISRAIDLGKQDCHAKLKRLGLWFGELDQLPALNLPLPETVRRFEANEAELDNELRQLKKDRQTAEKELKTARDELREVEYRGEVPTEQALELARQRRQDGWNLLRRRWVNGEDIAVAAAAYAPGKTVCDVYEQQVEKADLIADRLRREAERVSRTAALRARIESFQETLQVLSRQEEELKTRQENLAADWLVLWEPRHIKPLSAKEMLAWLTEMDKLCFQVSELSNKESLLVDRKRARRQQRQDLVDELKLFGESGEFPGQELDPLLVVAESILENIVRRKLKCEKLIDQQARAKTALAKAKKEQKEAETAQIAWRKQWDKALAGLGLPGQVLPGEALDLLETIGNCFEKLEKAKEFQSRINGIDRDMAEFAVDVRDLAAKVAPELKDLAPEQAVPQLHVMLGKTRQDHELLKKNKLEMEGLAAEIENSEKVLHSFDGRLAELLVTAKCDKSEDIATAIRKSLEYERLQEKVSAAKSLLAKVNEGIPLEQIKQQAGEVNVDELPGQIASLKREIDEDLYPGITAALKRIGEENKELQLMDGSGQAAAAAGEMEQVAARIQRLVEQYGKIKLAARVLRDAIERYREEHQDPIVQKASGIFSQLTLGSFSGLRADMNDSGNPILVGVRPGGSRVNVSGMSDGTCDQLYLALRFSTLESRLETSEPMPFIVDDILINFDDERSRITLKIMAELARKNQVILFTHHRQIVEAANSMVASGVVQIHEL